jgi:hypothetical protein
MGSIVNACIATGVGRAGTAFASGLASDWHPASKARPAGVMERINDEILGGMDVPFLTDVD